MNLCWVRIHGRIRSVNLRSTFELFLGALSNQKMFQISRIIAVPVFHASAAPVTHISTLKAGTATYVMRRFDMEECLTTVEKYDITDLAMVPPIVIAILMSPLSQKRPYLRKVRIAACGAAPLTRTYRRASAPSWGTAHSTRFGV